MIIDSTTQGIQTFPQPDGYRIHFRVWGSETAADLVVMLHGGMSHSGWQAPLGNRIAEETDDIGFLAVDLRGSGLNATPGHIPDGDLAVSDIVELLRSLKAARPDTRIHLAGWCFGAQVATVAAARLADRPTLSSLLMVCPGFFFTERYEDVLDRSVDAAIEAVERLSVSVAPEHPFIRIPLRPTDFTDRPELLAAIEADQLKLSHVTVGTIDSWGEIAERSEKDYGQIGPLPVWAVFGKRDRLVDNARVAEFLRTHPDVEVHELATGHAIHFEQPAALAGLLVDFIRKGQS